MYRPFEKTDLNKAEPIILGIESSCDETAAAVIKGRKILSDEIASSATIQAEYGGVVPEIAARAHLEHIDEIIENSGLSAADALSEMTMLEIEGVVRQESGKYFSLNVSES